MRLNSMGGSTLEILAVLMRDLLYLSLMSILSLLEVGSPVRMALKRPAWISGSPPVDVVPMSSIEIALPFGMVLSDPIGPVLMPPRIAVPEMVFVEVTPPFGMIRVDPSWIVLPPPSSRVPIAVVPVAPPSGRKPGEPGWLE